jgi:protein gp37
MGGKITTNEWTVCYGKNVGKSNETTDEEYVNELVNTATQKENIFWLKDGDGKPTTPYLKLEELDVERFNEKGI